MRRELDRVRLTLSRLSDMWLFTHHPLSYQVDLMLRVVPKDDWENIIYAIRGYGCLARIAGDAIESGVQPPAEWSRLFGECGQRLMFDLPDNLKLFDKRKFNKEYQKAFMFGFNTGGDSPSPR
jgi:hypothetical protein